MDYAYGHTSVFDTMDPELAMVLQIYLGIFLFLGIFGLISYLFKGAAMYRMAKREGMSYAWLSYVPVARVYLQGELSGDILFKKRSIKNPGLWLILFPMIGGTIVVGYYIAMLVVCVVTATNASSYHTEGVMGIIGLVFVLFFGYIILILLYQAILMVLRVLVNYQIYRKFDANATAIMHAVLGILIPMYESVVLFIHRNRPYNAGMEPQGMMPPVMEAPVNSAGTGTEE